MMMFVKIKRIYSKYLYYNLIIISKAGNWEKKKSNSYYISFLL